MITQQNIINHELIGLEAQILQSTNKALIGLSGKIVDETKSMLLIETSHGEKMIPKSHSKWQFKLNNQEFILDGNMITKRPEDRIKVKI